MAKTKHGIWAKMLASFARDAEPEEIAEAVEAIDEITSEEPENVPMADADVSEKLDTVIDQLQNLQTPKMEEDEDEEEKVPAEVTDEGPDKMDTIIDMLKKLLAAKGVDEEPVEQDPLKKLEEDLDELEAGKAPAEVPEETEDEDLPPEEGETFAPDEDPEEPESKFVDPEEINEEDEDEVDPEAVPGAAPEVKVDRRACDAMRAAIKAVKPVIAQLPPSQRKAAADAAAASIRKSYGLNSKASRNDYLRLKQRRRTADNAVRRADKALGQRIMAARNANLMKK